MLGTGPIKTCTEPQDLLKRERIHQPDHQKREVNQRTQMAHSLATAADTKDILYERDACTGAAVARRGGARRR